MYLYPSVCLFCPSMALNSEPIPPLLPLVKHRASTCQTPPTKACGSRIIGLPLHLTSHCCNCQLRHASLEQPPRNDPYNFQFIPCPPVDLQQLCSDIITLREREMTTIVAIILPTPKQTADCFGNNRRFVVID